MRFFRSTFAAVLCLFPILAHADEAPPAPQLGERFTGMYDVSFQPFAGGVRKDNASAAEIVRFEVPSRKWTLVFTRTELPVAQQLHDTKDVNGADRLGYLSNAVTSLRSGDQTAEVFRNEIVDYGPLRIGLITATAKPGGIDTLLQQGIIQITPRLYYSLAMTSPGAADPQTDKNVGEAVAAFKAVLDSVRPVDLTHIRQDQEDRLIRTRALFVNWTKARVLGVLVPERMLRIRQDGRDVGYVYIVEEPANSLPKKVSAAKGTTAGESRDAVDPKSASGFRVGMRMRTSTEPGKDTQIESWMFASFDRQHEVWSTTTIATDPKAATQKERENWRLELGTSDMFQDRQFDKGMKPEDLKDFDKANAAGGAGAAAPFRIVDRMKLKVQSKQRSGELPTLEREVPPFYLQQALGAILPRLLPLREKSGYAFASYSSDGRQIMFRYVDVGAEGDVAIGGRRQRAVTISDRLGFEGQPVLHYVTTAGEYLGTFNPATHVEITPTDRDTLAGIWQNVQLVAPGVQQ